MLYDHKIRDLLHLKGWSVRKLAERAGVPRQTADRLCKKLPKAVVAAMKLVRALGVPAEWLYDDKRGWEGGGQRGKLTLERMDAIWGILAVILREFGQPGNSPADVERFRREVEDLVRADRQSSGRGSKPGHPVSRRKAGGSK